MHFEYNGAAVLAAPIIAYTDMFTMCNVYSVHLVAQLTVSSTTPIWLNVAYSIGWNERKRKIELFQDGG